MKQNNFTLKNFYSIKHININVIINIYINLFKDQNILINFFLKKTFSIYKI